MRDHLNILHLLPHAGAGGDWGFARALALGHSEFGLEVTLAANGIKPLVSSRVKTVEIWPNRGLAGFLRSHIRLRRMASSFDIIHSHSPAVLALALGLKQHATRVVHTIHWQTPEGQCRRWLKSALFRRADKIHCLTRHMEEHIGRIYGIPKSHTSQVYPGRNSDQFRPGTSEERRRWRAAFSFDETHFVLTYVGRLSPEKRLDLLLKTLAAAEEPHWRLILAGTGPAQDALKQAVLQYGVEHQVRFAGHVENPRTVYAMADVHVLPSFSMEVFPLSVVEAALCGVPTIRGDAPGACEQVSPSATGEILREPNPEALVDLLRRLDSNDAALLAMGDRARRYALEHFTEERMVHELLALYEALHHSNTPSAPSGHAVPL